MAKNIVLCSDGTGNQDIKNRGTNVFKIYEAVDTQGHKRGLFPQQNIPKDAGYSSAMEKEGAAILSGQISYYIFVLLTIGVVIRVLQEPKFVAFLSSRLGIGFLQKLCEFCRPVSAMVGLDISLPSLVLVTLVGGLIIGLWAYSVDIYLEKKYRDFWHNIRQGLRDKLIQP
jgi:hypothetical protein